ncbi:ATP-dependent RNA helicase dbp7 [Boothiomyces macroporosus]|uniref:ATP-dependent RNA helicase n=1 Tax=Boothiomyces macroporosus TaxID=261099 RepID=A0AAD5UH25_9FUNG|nr:ATP-dependent RNA helicase dbp7 [Boothiomyces macroporosus]
MDLQLNFDLNDTPKNNINVTTVLNTLKKGSWKKRRGDAKRIVRKKTGGKPNTETVQPAQQPFKRKAVSGPPREEVKAGFSSSIFTANPELPSRQKKQKKEETTDKPVIEAQAIPQPVEEIEKKEIPAKISKEPILEDTTSQTDFGKLGLHPLLVNHLKKLNISNATQIQKSSIPKLQKEFGRDIIIQAQTAAELEGVHGKDFFTRSTGTFAIILAPTRELAQQIATVLESLLHYTINASENGTRFKHWIVSGILVGGESKKSEKARLRKGINILVATPGRLLDHLKTTESFNTGNLRWLVLDEADNLLHLGFEETLRDILKILNEKGRKAIESEARAKIKHMPFERQTVLCSATIEGGVQKLAEESLRDPVFIKAESKQENTESGENDSSISIPKQLKQLYVLSPAKLRLVNMIGLIRKITNSGKLPRKIIIFLATGDSVDWHFDILARISEMQNTEQDDKDFEFDPEAEIKPVEYNDLPKLRAGYDAKHLPNCKLFKLHGSMQQSERHAVYTGYSPSSNYTKILFCTDVAARGLDLPDVSDIIQYDPPADVRDYIHRIGRTARLGKEGQAFIFLLPSEAEYLDLLEDYHCHVTEEPMVPILETLIPLANSKKTKNQKHSFHEIAATDVHMEFERFVQSSQPNLIHAQKAFSSHIRAYTTHIASEKHIFHIRKLHLGHIAKSFCLREAPQQLQSKLGNLAKSLHENDLASGGGITASSMKRKANQMAKNAMVSEFADGNIAQLMKKRK